MTVFELIANVWIGGMMLLAVVLVPYELFFGGKNHNAAAAAAVGSAFWPIVLAILLWQLVTDWTKGTGKGRGGRA